MNRSDAGFFSSRTLLIALFVFGCFPARGLYFLLQGVTKSGQHYSHQPVLRAPADANARLDAAKIPLPTRLTRVPRALKRSPALSAPVVSLVAALLPTPAETAAPFPRARTELAKPQTFASSPPSGRAPPSAV
jgi:hypothetical protein